MDETFIAENRKRLLAEIAAATKWLEEAQRVCPHTNTKYWPRQIAEEDSYVECLSCGKHLPERYRR